MKKILSLVLAIMMVLSMASTAFAGTFEDVEESKFANAIETLYALGVVNGYDNDGELSYRPDNAIKRGEFAKLLVEALGLGSMADGSASSFADVKGHWADGYIAIANGLQIVEGKGNGMFAPDANVTYENAMTMILRTLGYTNAAVNKGVNAYNGTAYMALAKKVGLLEGLTIKSGNITRGEIAAMLYNALEVNNVNATEKGYEPLATILLDNIATKAEVAVNLTTLTKGHLVDLTPYLFQTIEVYKNGDSKIAYVYKSNSTVKEGTITKVAGSVIFVKDAAGKTADFNTTGSSIIVNAALKADGVNLAVADVVKVILEGTTVKAVITEKVSVMNQISKAYRAGATVFGTIQLPKTTAGKVDLSKVTVTGAVDAIEDIEADDVVVAYHSAGLNANVAVKLLVVRDTVEGKITKVSGDDYYINDVAYALNSSDSAITLGAKGVFYLDNNGDIAYFAPANDAPASSSYVMINSATNGYQVGDVLIKDAKIEFVNAKNEKVALIIDEDTIVKTGSTTASAVNASLTVTNADLVKGKLVTYKAEDGVVTEITVVAISQTAQTLNQGSKTFMPSANLVVFHFFSDKVNVITLADLKAEFTADYVANTNGEITAIIVKASIAATTPDTYAIITKVESTLNAKDQPINLLTAYVNGEIKTFNTTAIDDKYEAAIGKVVKLTFTNNVVSNVTEQSDTARTVDAIRTDRFLSGTTWYVLSDNAVVYVMKDATTIERIGSIDDLDYENAEVKVFDTDGKASTGYEIIIVSYK